jgi:hypothetical protein
VGAFAEGNLPYVLFTKGCLTATGLSTSLRMTDGGHGKWRWTQHAEWRSDVCGENANVFVEFNGRDDAGRRAVRIGGEDRARFRLVRRFINEQ